MILNMGIVGLGFVGSSVQYGFRKNVDIFFVDPRFSDNTLEQCVDFFPEFIFVCVPTPAAENGDVDVSIAEGIIQELSKLCYEGIVVIKSTIPPSHLTRFVETTNLRIVYNPEFLTEVNAHHDFCNPPMQILGGDWGDCEKVERAYVHHSAVKVVPTFKTDITTASLLKYTINSWLATKVMFMNELRDVFEASDTDTPWEQFTYMLSHDKRIGDSHMEVPGPDGYKGFGGHCFPKETEGFLYYAESLGIDMTVLKQAVETNKDVRQQSIKDKQKKSNEETDISS